MEIKICLVFGKTIENNYVLKILPGVKVKLVGFTPQRTHAPRICERVTREGVDGRLAS